MTATATRDDTRGRILDVAVELIAEKGFAGTSTREVCERMGFTKAALWYHFRTKDDLLAALLAPIDASLAGLVEQAEGRVAAAGPDPHVLLAGYVDLVAANADLVRVLYDDPSARSHPAAQPVREHYTRLYRLLTGTRTGSPDLLALARARGALGAVHAVLLRGERGERGQPDAALRRVALAASLGALDSGALDSPHPSTCTGRPAP